MALAVGDLWTAAEANLANRTGITYKANGIASSGTANVVLATQVISDPYGTGVPYKVQAHYLLGFVTVASGFSGRMYITVNGAGVAFDLVSTLSGAHVYYSLDMASGGSVTIGGSLTNIGSTMATFADPTNNLLTCEVEPL
jgi:carbon monoxide dehydrogenase subunit G